MAGHRDSCHADPPEGLAMMMRFNRKRLVLGVAVLAACMCSMSHAAEKKRIAIQTIEVTESVMERADAEGAVAANALLQIVEGADAMLIDAVSALGQFEVVGASDLQRILDAQDVQESGLYDLDDPQTARSMELSGFPYIAVLTVTNYSWVVREGRFAGPAGDVNHIIESVHLQAALKIYDVERGTLFDTAVVEVDDAYETEILVGTDQRGSRAMPMIGAVSRQLATDAAVAVMDSLAPAKVIGFDQGNLFFNRSVGGGVNVGDFLEMRAPGAAMLDPETGEVLGTVERGIGWAVVTRVGDRFSEAEAIELTQAPTIGHTRLRRAKNLPAGIDPATRAGGPFSAPAAAPLANGQQGGPAESQTTGMLNTTPMTLAVFVANTSSDVPDEKVATLEAQLQASLSKRGIRVVSRSQLLNAVSGLAQEGSNAGTGMASQTDAQRVLSDQASVVSLARQLGADAILTATVTSLIVDERRLTRPTEQVVLTYTLNVSWALLSGATGASIDGSSVRSQEKFRESANISHGLFDGLDRLLQEDADIVASGVALAINTHVLQTAEDSISTRAVTVNVSLANMTVPEIRQSGDSWIVGSGRYAIEPFGCTVTVDGFLVGSTPGPIRMATGPARLRVEHPLCQTFDGYVSLAGGANSIDIPMVFSEEGAAEWRRQTAFFESLKDGAVLRKTDLEMARAMATFMKNSRITIDTSNVQNLGVGQPSLWLQELE